jgi:hypothetical protein
LSIIEPTPAQRKGGWTAEALTKYYADRERAAMIRVFGEPDAKKKRNLVVQNTTRFRPLRWGKKKHVRTI